MKGLFLSFVVKAPGNQATNDAQTRVTYQQRRGNLRIVNNINHNMDLDLITFVLTIIQIIFITLGMVLKSMIIFFEHFGRDTQKRSLFNRVS